MKTAQIGVKEKFDLIENRDSESEPIVPMAWLKRSLRINSVIMMMLLSPSVVMMRLKRFAGFKNYTTMQKTAFEN